MSLRLRLTLTYSLFVALIVVVFGGVLYALMQKQLMQEMDRRLHIRANQAQLALFPGASSLTPADLTQAKLDLSPLADLDAPGLYVQVLDRAGTVVATSKDLQGVALPVQPSSLSAALAGKQSLGDVRIGNSRSVRVLSVPVTSGGKVVGMLQVGESRQPLQQTLDNLSTTLLLLGAAVLVAAAVAGWLVARQGLRPLSIIARDAAAIAARRDFSQRLSVEERADEVGQLAATIDHLLSTVDGLLRQHQDFVADTSHELRNPLLAIRTNLDLLDRVADADARAECVREAREQVERMSRLLGDLLLLARAEATRVIEFRPLALRALVERVAAEQRPRLAGRKLIVQPGEQIELPGDEGRLIQVLTNLVANAMRHTPPGGTITIDLQRDGEWACLSVADTGEGIAPEHLPHLFDRFYRVRGGDEPRGAGLGLAIVKHLVEAHGGCVCVQSEVGVGSRFEVRLPLAPRPALAARRTVVPGVRTPSA